MTGKMLLLSALLVCVVTVVHSDVDTMNKAKAYLKKYGYMVDDDDSKIMDAMKQFQFMANITMTGELDADTMMMMNMPRCGVVDVIDQQNTLRKRRYTAGVNGNVYKWPRTALTYRIDSRTPDLPVDDVDSTMQTALQIWAAETPLTFTRVSGSAPADIIITFVRGDHGDNNNFDGQGNVLAHAYFPSNGGRAPLDGDAHFDEDELWTIGTGTNLFQVAAHEFGHSLGLGHSDVDAAVMAPFYRGYDPGFKLHPDDVAGIKYLYGETSGMPEVTMAPTDVTCTGRLDAITSTDAGHTYIFEGSRVWKQESRMNRIAAGFPKPIGEVFAGLPDNIDAALFSTNKKTYFFKGSQYWQYTNEVLDNGYPRAINRDLPGVPNNLDAAFVWSGNNVIYFVKGDEYYRFRRGRVDTGYPRPLSLWNIPGNQVGAAFQNPENSRTYFFTDDGSYYQFDDRNFRPASGFPQQVAPVWQGCVNNLESNDNSGVSGLASSIPVLVISMAVGAFRA
ncbi:stromelysin-1-like [Asterias amurensis]|uniref:stromelysin-1-like n=1 Tax=Asterias amurensis TaxID=7602 RepID=UPI003AB6D69C